MSKDYAGLARNSAGELVIEHHLRGVRPGEDVQPRLNKLDDKLFSQLRRNGKPYVGRPPTPQESFGQG